MNLSSKDDMPLNKEMKSYTAQLAGVVEYGDCNYAEDKTQPGDCCGYDNEPSANESSLLELWEMWSTCHYSQLQSDHAG